MLIRWRKVPTENFACGTLRFTPGDPHLLNTDNKSSCLLPQSKETRRPLIGGGSAVCVCRGWTVWRKKASVSLTLYRRLKRLGHRYHNVGPENLYREQLQHHLLTNSILAVIVCNTIGYHCHGAALITLLILNGWII